MFRRMVIVFLGMQGFVAAARAQDDFDSLLEKTMKAAAARVAPCVVQIDTSGGTDIVGSQIRKGSGPTTGLIVSADGYVISSAFNFSNKPSAIFVAVPGHKDRYPAKMIAADHSRMLALLKIPVGNLPVPEATPKKEIHVGQWSLALGRSWTGLDTPPAVSAGIVSALDRIWGMAIQTDAKVSPINYGGPLVDLQGRVMGVLVPLSPRGQDETAGVEWYDSGIGFAIPLEDINRVLPKLKTGKDLKRGLLGISFRSNDLYSGDPVIGLVAPDSAAQKAGIKPGDQLLEINGQKVYRQAQIMHLLGNKYEGELVTVKVKRGKDQLTFPNLSLSASLTAFIHPFLGVLPVRDDPELGEEVRYVFPQSPAATAGIKPGDRIMKWSPSGMPGIAFSGRDQLTSMLDHLSPGMEISLEVRRKGTNKVENVKLTLGVLTDEVPEDLPEVASLKKALEPRKQAPVTGPRGMRAGGPQPPMPPQPARKADDKPKTDKKKVATGLLKRATAARDHEYWLFVPEDYDPNIAYALVIWLHPAGKDKDKETERVLSLWDDFCSANHMILLCPRAESDTGWMASEVDFVHQVARDVMSEFTIDSQRVVAHGMGLGGQMAFYLGFNARDLVRGVATTGAALNTPPKDNVNNQRLEFFIVAGGKDPIVQAIADSKNKLTERKFPVVYHPIPEMGQQYLDAVTLRELIRWIDALDRQ